MTTIERFRTETIPILLKRWPEHFRMSDALEPNEPTFQCDCEGIDPESLDDIAGMSRAVGGVTMAVAGHDVDGSPYWTGYYFNGFGGSNAARDSCSEPDARLTAFCSMVAEMEAARSITAPSEMDARLLAMMRAWFDSEAKAFGSHGGHSFFAVLESDGLFTALSEDATRRQQAAHRPETEEAAHAGA